MASKQTKRERRELAKKARLEAQRRAARARRLRRIYSAAGVAVVVALIAFFVMQSGKAGRERVAALNDLATAAGCGQMQTHLENGREHVGAGTTVQYQTSPPTSGNHLGRWDKTGVHVNPIPNEVQVHNLEHGHVVLQYKTSVSDEVKSALEGVARNDPSWVIAAPNDTMTPTVAFTAWGKIMTCDDPSDASALAAAATKFVEVTKDNGPESIAGEPNDPGQPQPSEPTGTQPSPDPAAS